MKRDEVRIGGTYRAKVTDKLVSVRIDAENPNGGWDATNLDTNRKVRIKTAQRLRSAVGGKTSGAKAAKDTSTRGRVAKKAEFTTTNAKTKKDATRAKRAGDGGKRMSCIDAAASVLSESAEPLNAKEMIEAITAKGLWTSPGGKTPHATLYSAILREIQKKGDEARFRKTERGKFTVA
jgi:hypothetical protein